MLYRLDISTIYLYAPFLFFKIFIPWKSVKIHRPSLVILSLLKASATHIILYINIFICFKYYIIWNQFFKIKIHVKEFFKFKFDLNMNHRSYYSNKKPWTTEKKYLVKKKNMKQFLNWALYTLDGTYNLYRLSNSSKDIYI